MLKPNRLRAILICCFLTLFIFPKSSQAQEFIENLAKIFEFDVGPVRQDSTFRHTKIVLAPITSYEPSTSWGFGIGAKFLFKPFGAGADTRTSNIPLSVQYTLRNQFIAFSEYTVFFPHEAFLLKGNLGYSKFPIGYFGIGSGTKDEDQIDISFNSFLFEPLLLKRVAPNLFIGGGWRLNSFKSVELLEKHGDDPAGTSLQDSLGSTSSGLEFAITLDSRDNVLNARKGTFAEFTHGFYNETFGSTSSFMLTKLNYRQYWTLLEDRPYDVLAIELYTRLSWNDTPELELSSLGGPELLRGFREARFRDRYSFFSQVEYRWQALNRIGFVFYGGVGEVTDKLSNLDVRNLKYSAGTGIRFKIVKSENLNIRIDYAFGLGKSSDQNFYLGIAEAF
ncbi:MAG: BamA/TamA family outer membrane protein [Saprospiraceae bacterium]